MIVEQTPSGYTATGRGLLRKIISEGWDRKDAIKGFAECIANQLSEVRAKFPHIAAFASVRADLMPMQCDWLERYYEVCPEAYAREEAMTALATQHEPVEDLG